METALTDWNDIANLAWADTWDLSYPFVSRPLFYLRCSQLGLFPTSVNARSAFGTGIGQDLYFRACNDIFGGEYDYMLLGASVDQINFQFGGKRPNVGNVIFTNGVLDAHFTFGITEEYGGDDVTVFNLPGKSLET